MSTDTVETSSVIETLADLVDRLGGVPLERIRFRPAPGLADENDVLAAAESPRKRLCELIDGVLVEKAMGLPESFLGVYLICRLSEFVRARNLGIVTGADGMMKLFPGRIRIPDVAFSSWDRLQNRRVPTAPIPSLAPDLAIEVLSQSNTAAEMTLKREDYFRAGVRLVWEINPETRTADVYTSVDQMTTLTVDDTLDGQAVLPGFSLPLRELFSELDRHG